MRDNAIRPLAPVVAPTPAPTPPATVAAHPFAEVLRQNRQAASRPAAAPTAAARTTAPAPTTDAATPRTGEGANADAPAPEATAKPKAATTTAKAHDTDAADDADTCVSTGSTSATPAGATEPHAKDSQSRDGAPDGADTAAAAAAIASARANVDAKIDASTAAGGDASGRGDSAANGDGTRLGLGLPAGAPGSSPIDPTSARTAIEASADRQAGIEGARDTTDSKTIDPSPGTSFAALLADSKPARASASASDRHGGENLAPTASATGFVGAGTTGVAAPATTVATLPTLVHSPDFATAFGVEVSVLAKDGVQRAELHLNPAEMGPVSIRITLDGSQARVDFGADVAATRHLIEAGLPELASALRDAGFTLAGGGVAQHSTPQGGRGDDADPARGDASRSTSVQPIGGDASSSRMVHRVSAGGVDLYA